MDDSAAKPLADFLRARRQQVCPEQHGLAPGPDRQVPGLRRDEVAMLAGISTDYYVRLEQGRERSPSQSVLDGLATALLLDRTAARHLRMLATGEPADEGEPDPSRLSAVRVLLGALTVPALLVNRRLDVVAANTFGTRLHAGLQHRENYARMVFLSPGAREFFTEWPELAECVVASLRAATGTPGLADLVGELAVASAEFSTAWARHGLYEKALDHKLLRHPVAGSLAFDQHVLELPRTGGHRIWAYYPADEATSAALGRLAGYADHS
ncbi:transcriptional regulator with XRE-family HTH domain [Kutzneria viridogrisea]|uniref:Transcriptional regulator with XRE-family HTH domain n=1 Tax=Kutzneria viridogrisea TaxID=47990 RepID=A0ABR6B9A5_9PSEU|nr:transcriptional regulator with XRE-family HTH domain [Kutzneria viridogrisea]